MSQGENTCYAINIVDQMVFVFANWLLFILSVEKNDIGNLWKKTYALNWDLFSIMTASNYQKEELQQDISVYMVWYIMQHLCSNYCYETHAVCFYTMS